MPRVPKQSAEPFVPSSTSLPRLRAAAKGCRGCPLFAPATQTVFGEGSAGAALMLVGEQPGDTEDLAGRPFVGPAGKLLDRALEAAGIPRGEVYVTNAVKHFKFEERGKRRIHKRPRTSEINACNPWLQAEIAAIKPRVVVCMGAVAAQSVFGAGFQLTPNLGVALSTPLADAAFATLHPSALLRMQDREERERAFAALVKQLRLAYRNSRGETPRIKPR
jgi:uracil-DNA glycosylase family protein